MASLQHNQHFDANRYGKQRSRVVVVVESRKVKPKRDRRPRRDEQPMEVKKEWKLEILWRDNFTCQECGYRGSAFDMTVDHIHPISKGGSKRDPSNLQTMCRPCNLGKGNEIYE